MSFFFFIFVSTLFLSMSIENCAMVSYSEYCFFWSAEVKGVITLPEGIKNMEGDEKGSV